MRRRVTVRVSTSEGGPPRLSRLRRVLLWLLNRAGAATLALTPWLGLRWALPVGLIAFALSLRLPTYRDRR